MSDVTTSNRRDFLRNIVKSAMGCATFAIARRDARAQAPVAPKNVIVGTESLTTSTKPLIGMEDLRWLGMCHAGSGFSYNEGQVAVRYVSGERRLLMFKWHQRDETNGNVGNLTELRTPALSQTVDASQAMIVVREWANWTWLPTGDLLSSLGSGWHIGGLCWDQLQQVVWYSMYPYFAPGLAMPFLGATRLNDDGTITKYGPWYYVSSSSDAFRKVCYWFVPIPASAQADLGGRTVALGAATLGASGGTPTNWGPGLTAIHLPDLGSTGPVEVGIPLMDYSPGAGGLAHPWFHCRREADYDSINSPVSGAIPAPVGGEGFWQASADNVTGVAWIETSTRQGLILLGQRVSHASWYGFSDSRNMTLTDGTTVHAPLPDGVGIDTWAVDQGSSGFHSDAWQSAFWRFDPAQIRQVARGQRKASADDMRPSLLGQWKQQWPPIPTTLINGYVFSGYGSAVADVTAKQLVWVQARSKPNGYEVLPTVHVFGLPD